jgi:hypothetical protein
MCLSHLIHTVRPCLIHICHAAPVTCHDHAVLKATSQGHGTARNGQGMAWHGMCELASAVQRRQVGQMPAFGFFQLPRGVHEGCFQKHTNELNCKTSSSVIIGYHADFNEGHGTVGERQECGMAGAN